MKHIKFFENKSTDKSQYILLADICYDWSSGEYSTSTVEDVYLGHGEFESETEAKSKATELLNKYFENHKYDNIVKDETYVSVKSL